MQHQLSKTEWSDIDHADKAQQYIGYLDAAGAFASVQAYKQQTYDLMKIEKGHHILDIGCGTGADVFALAKLTGATGRVVGLDTSEAMIQEARKRGPESGLPIEFDVGDVYHLAVADNTFDRCRADRVFQHLADAERALAEMIRVTRPGGRIVIFDIDYGTLVLDSDDAPLTRKIVNTICDDHRNGWAGRRLHKQCKQASLRDVSVVPATGILLDYPIADQLFELSTAAKALQASGAISAREATDWSEGLRDAGQAGQFFCSITGYIACGVK